MTAAELETAGLITKVLPKEGFLQSVLKVARDAVKLPEKSLRLSKEMMMHGLREELLRVNERELESLRAQAKGRESKEAIRGFAESQAKKKREKEAKL